MITIYLEYSRYSSTAFALAPSNFNLNCFSAICKFSSSPPWKLFSLATDYTFRIDFLDSHRQFKSYLNECKIRDTCMTGGGCMYTLQRRDFHFNVPSKNKMR